MERFGDPGFRYHAAMARLWGVMALRLANAEVVPIDYGPYAARIREFISELAPRRSATNRAALRPLYEAVGRLGQASSKMSRHIEAALGSEKTPAARLAGINRALMTAERALLSRDGIPGRPWYRHLIYAPKPTYAPETLPGVTEAIASRDRGRITDQVARLAAALDRAAAALRSAK
jgi:N-acetylated-alpha-linked acidic dipeptidase